MHGARAAPGDETVTAADVKQMPGAFGDAFRAIEALPGVTPLVSGLPYFLVRGAPPGDTGFFIDGVRVPALFHLGVGAAVIHPSLIDRVDFYPGGYPARFGRFTGGVLSGRLATVPDKPHEEASVRLLDAGALVSTPLADGRADVLASGRYGYPGPLLSLFAPDVGLSYWDYQARARWRPTDRDGLGVFAFGSYDSLSSKNSSTGKMEELLGMQFHRVDLRWDRATSATGALRLAVTLGYDRSAVSGGTSSLSPTVNLEDSIESQTLGVRTEWTDQLSPELETRVGSDVVFQPFHVIVPGVTTSSSTVGSTVSSTGPFGLRTASDLQQVDLDSGIYGELAWRVADGVELRPGARLDAFTSRSSTGDALLGENGGGARAAVALDPRLAARWETTPWLAWIASMGMAHQASNVPFPSPGLQFSQLSRGLQSSFQYSAGAEVELPFKLTATLDGFVHDYTGIGDLFESCPSGEQVCTFDGRAFGMELLVRRRLTERFTGWLSYTLSRTERDAFNRGHWTRIVSEFDRPHVFNAVLAADLGARWRAGARVLAYSGLPYASTIDASGNGPPDSRGPPFVRLDLRLEKKWRALGGTLTLVFEWLNALLNKESFGTTCSSSGSTGAQTCAPQAIGPITLPSVGVEEVW